MLKKAFYITALSIILLSSSSTYLHATTKSLDDALFDDDIDLLFDDYPSDYAPSSGPTFRADPVLIMTILNQINAPEILQEEFYIHTNVLNARNIIDLPIFEPIQCCASRTCYEKQTIDPCHSQTPSWIVGGHLFYNQTDKAHFTAKSEELKSYLNLDPEGSLIEKIENLIPLIKQFLQFDLDIPKIYRLIGMMTVQERRLGLMLHATHHAPKYILRTLLPVYYRERNFFLNNDARRALEEDLGASNDKEFENRHFVSDQLGIGDMRVELTRSVLDCPSIHVTLGGMFTLPTAFAFKRGLRGHFFDRDDFVCLPSINLQKILCDIFEAPGGVTPEILQKTFNTLRGFLLNALDRLAANLLDTQPGNGGHFGVGLMGTTDSELSSWLPYCWAQPISMRSRISLEYLFPQRAKRMFIKAIDPNEFKRRNFEDEAQAADNLAFLQEKFIERLNLIAIDTIIQPGLIFRLTNKFCYDKPHWGLYTGSDWWVQSREFRKQIKEPLCVIDSLALEKSLIPFAWQYRSFVGIHTTIHRQNYDLLIGLNADGAVAGSGIGDDFTLSLNIEAHF